MSNQEHKDGLEMFWEGKERELPSTMSGFTPAPDTLIEKYCYITALVWGKVWRYCQMKDGVCRASRERLAKELGLGVRTIDRHIEILVNGKYLEDTTPSRRNKPHIYKDTGKIRITVSVAVSEWHTGMPESHSEGVTESHEESIKKESKKESTGTAFKSYENNIGLLTPAISDAIKDALDTYPPEWITDAIQEAVEYNKRNWKYIHAILSRWERDGKDSGKKKPENNKPSGGFPTIGEDGKVVE